MTIAPDPSRVQRSRPPLEPGLYIVATPIGNLRDITLRALDVLAGADVIAAEDTRVTRKLLSAHGLSGRLVAYHEHNAASQEGALMETLNQGGTVALVSDAGTPLVSDPGARLVAAAIAAGVRVFPIPGASASLAALCAAGLPSERFLFVGFLPPKSGARRAALDDITDTHATLIFYETGPRLADCLADLAAVLGDRDAAVARELTKLFEEFRRGSLGALAAHYANAEAPKGEIVVLVGPPAPQEDASDAALDALLARLLESLSVKEAAALAAEALNAPRKRAYARALALKQQS